METPLRAGALCPQRCGGTITRNRIGYGCTRCAWIRQRIEDAETEDQRPNVVALAS